MSGFNTLRNLTSSSLKPLSIEEQQLYAYSIIINHTLNYQQPLVTNITKDLQDGLTLARFVQVLTGETITTLHYSPLTEQEKIDNIESVLSLLKRLEIKTTATANDIFKGETKSIQNLMFYINYRYRLHDVPVRIIDFSRWIKNILRINNPLFDLKVEFCDGVLLARLINSYEPNSINLRSLPKDKSQLAQLGLDTAMTKLNIPKLINAQSMSSRKVDDNALILYLSYFVMKETRFGSNDLKVVEKINLAKKKFILERRKFIQDELHRRTLTILESCEKNDSSDNKEEVLKYKKMAQNLLDDVDGVEINDDVIDEIVDALQTDTATLIKDSTLPIIPSSSDSSDHQHFEELLNEKSSKISDLEQCIVVLKEKLERSEQSERDMRIKAQNESTLMGIIEEFEKSVNDLNGRMKEKNKQIDVVEEKLKVLELEKSEKIQELNDCKKSFNDSDIRKDQKIEELKETIKNFEENKMNLKDENKKIEEFEQEKMKSGEEIKKLQKEIEENATLLKEKINVIKTMEENTKEKEELMKEKEQRLLSVEEELRQSQSKIEDINNTIEKKNKENVLLKGSIEEMNENILKQEKQQKEYEEKCNENVNKIKANEVELQKKITSLEEVNSTQKLKIKDLQKVVDATNLAVARECGDNNEYENIINQLKDTIEQKDAEIEKIQQEFKQLETTSKEAEHNAQTTYQTINSLTEINSQKSTLQNEIDTITNDCKQIKKLNEQLKLDIQNEKEQLSKQIQNKEEEVKNKIKQIKELEQVITKKNTEIETSQQTIQTKEDQIKKLQEELNIANKENSATKKELAEWKNKEEVLQKKYQELQQVNKETTENVESLKKSIKTLKESEESFTKELKISKNIATELKRQLSVKEEEHQKIFTSKTKEIEKLSENIESKNTEITKLKSSIEELKLKIKDGLEIQTKLQTEVEKVTKEKETLIVNHKTAHKQKETEIEAKQENINSLNKQIEEANNTIKQKETEIKELTEQQDEEVKKLTQSRNEVQKELTELQQRITGIKEEAKEKVQRVESKIQENNQSVEDMKKEMNEAKEELRIKAESVQLIETKIYSQKQTNSKLQRKIDELERRLENELLEMKEKERIWKDKTMFIVEEEEDKKVVFNGLALAIKMVMPKEVLKIDNTMLYDQCRKERVPLKDWNCWLANRLAQEIN
ncbi:hypothetical protein QTN25_000965 [Entamoeba marina]